MSNVCCMKPELNSFIENKCLHGIVDESKCKSTSVPNENILARFPLKNDQELVDIELILQSEDLTYTKKLVCINI